MRDISVLDLGMTSSSSSLEGGVLSRSGSGAALSVSRVAGSSERGGTCRGFLREARREECFLMKELERSTAST